ncbi:hypothetical protein AAMO2058_000940600 [Amorphochlora amoebiformis]
MAYQSMGELKRSERISSDGLQSFLDILNLGHYTEKFRENGMQDVESLKLIREWDVAKSLGDAVGMKVGESIRIYHAIQREDTTPFEPLIEEAKLFEDGDGSESGSRRLCCGACCILLGVLAKVMKPIDFIFPFDHREEFRRRVLSSHSGESIRSIFAGISSRWILVFSLVLNAIMEMWSLLPQEEKVSPIERFVWESTMAISTFCAYGAVVMFALFELNLSLVSRDNCKAYLLTVSDAWVFAEVMIVTSSVSLFFSTAYVGLKRVQLYTPPSYRWIAIIPFLSIIGLSLTTLLSINFMTYVSVKGGLMVGCRREGKIHCPDLGKHVKVEKQLVDAVIDRVVLNAEASDRVNNQRQLIGQ